MLLTVSKILNSKGDTYCNMNTRCILCTHVSPVFSCNIKSTFAMHDIPYSPKFSWQYIFANFVRKFPFVKI